MLLVTPQYSVPSAHSSRYTRHVAVFVVLQSVSGADSGAELGAGHGAGSFMGQCGGLVKGS
mgnify:CR=1 FL=1